MASSSPTPRKRDDGRPDGASRRRFLRGAGGAMAAFAAPPVMSSGTESPRAPSLQEPSLPFTPVDLGDFEARARQLMNPAVWAFVSGGAADEHTVRWNIERLADQRLMPQALVDVSQLDTAVELFGERLPFPLILAPTANHRLVHPEGEIATARGADAAGTTFVLSSGSNTSIEDVAKATRHPLWFQLYVQNDRKVNRDLVQRVEAAGARALCITVDSPVPGTRNRQERSPLVFPPGVGHPHYAAVTEPRMSISLDSVQPSRLEWSDIEWFKSITSLPVVLKGILNPADAERAIAVGADGIIVSNHGGRILDTVPATIDVLPRIIDQVAGRVPVLVDGGIRRGTDIVKALAFGARAVLVGRPYLYGLACGGSEGVTHVIKILRKELLLAMALLGRPNISSIDRSTLWP